MTEFLTVLAVISLILALAYAVYYHPTAAALRALHQALERGEIRPDDYASHLAALEHNST